MYQTLLILHSWSRWFVLIFGLIAVYRAYVGWTGRRPFVKCRQRHERQPFRALCGCRCIIGFGLYFGLSPWGLNAMKQAGAMKDPTARFFGMEHVVVMILAAILAQVGRLAIKKTSDDTLKHKKAFTYFGIALLLVLLMIPWGIWNPARPLFRL